jgi:fumarylacetoacetate (FAA) hydrolase
MKLVTFLNNDKERLGLFVNNKVYDLKICANEIDIKLPSKMQKFLEGSSAAMKLCKKVEKAIKSKKIKTYVKKEIKMLAPVPHPTSCRDGYAFRQHVATARRNRGVEMIPEFDQFPIFYFTNHNSIVGEGDVYFEADHFEKLDFELECACVLNKHGRNIDVKDADSYIAGYLIMNDFSARRLQMEEMKLNLGPAKGKDFATAIGPWLVTRDELKDSKISTESGDKYDLRMTATHNGKLVSDGNLKDMNWTFAEIIERASYGVDVFPGDVIGSGTCGTGCYLELNGTRALQAKEKEEEYKPVWLQAGDTIELEITGLGKLTNRVLKTKNNYSILAKKKNSK